MADESKPKCFVISPIGGDGTPERKHADQVLRYLIRSALQDQFDVLRADEDSNPGEITPRMIATILDADLIVADVTGGNPNVFYEIAIAHGYHRPTVLLQRAGDKRNFDIKDIRALSYDLTDPGALEGAVEQLRKYVDQAIRNPNESTNPLSAAGRFAQVQQSGDPLVESNVQILTAIEELRSEVRLSRRPIRRVNATAPPDLTSAIEILRRIIKDGRAQRSDFVGSVKPNTSSRFDRWARNALARIEQLDADADQDELDALLFDHKLFGTNETDDDDSRAED